MKLAEIAGIPKETALEIVEEKRDKAAAHNRIYQANTKARHEGHVKERKFQVGDLVWKMGELVWKIVEKVFSKMGRTLYSERSTSNRTLLTKILGRYKGV